MDQGQTGKGGEAAAETATRLLETVRTLAAELNPRHILSVPVNLDCSLDRDLGLDSLGRVELLARLESAFNVTIPEHVLSTAETPRDLLRAVLGAHGRKETVFSHAVEALSLGAAAAAPQQAATLTEALEWHVAAHPERPHIRFYSDEGEGEIITYQDLLNGAEAVAGGLQQLGLNPHEAVIIMLPTGHEYFYTFMGILMAGGIPVPVYPPGRPAQVEEHLRRHVAIANNCLAGMIIAMPETVRFAEMLQSLVPGLRHLVTPGDVAAAAGGPCQRPALSGGDVAFLQYTSGSTGDPKGVILTHSNLLANIRAMGEALAVTSKDVFISWLPLYHDMGLIGAWLGSLYYAVPLVVMSPLAFIARPQRWLWAIHRFRGTLSASPNFAFELCLKRLGDEELAGLDLSSLRKVMNGAEAVSPQTVENFENRFARFGLAADAVMPVYGLAECSVGLAFPPPDRPPLIDRVSRASLMEKGVAAPAGQKEADPLRFAACGRPLPGHQVRVVDTADRELPERHEGILQFRGPSATSGYMRAPEKTRELFHDEWLDSGDMAYISGGDVFITGRKKDIIIRAGQHTYPEELEEAIGGLPGIRKGRIAVFGCPDPALGSERLVVLAETRESDPGRQAALRAQVNEIVTSLTGAPADDVALAPPDTVLKTSSGKIRRSASRSLYESGAIGSRPRAVWLQALRLHLSALLPALRRGIRDAASTCYAAYVWLLAGVAAVPLWVVIVLLPSEQWRWKLAAAALRLMGRAAGLGFAVIGRENLPPPGQPCLFVSNHQSYLDGFVIAAALDRTLSFVAKAELRGNFFARLLLERLGAAFVERFDTLKSIEDARRAASRGRAGRPLVFFAEGTFTRVPGLRPFRMGAFEAAAAEKLPIVPVAIRGTRSVLRDVSWFPRRGGITVIIGPAIDPAGQANEDVFTAAVALRNRTRQWILQHCGEPDLQ